MEPHEVGGDDLATLLGVTIPTGRPAKPVECGQRAPKAKPKRVEQPTWNNFHTFTFGGYVARVRQLVCTTCAGRTRLLEGVFIEEIHESGTRRMTALAKGAQWPMGLDGEHRCEVWEEEVQFCGQCITQLGFGREVGVDPTYTLMIQTGDSAPGRS